MQIDRRIKLKKSGKFMAMFLKLYLNMKVKKLKYKSLDNIHTNYLKFTYQAFGNAGFDLYTQAAFDCLKVFIKDLVGRCHRRYLLYACAT
jgi:hypothetical protein